MIRNIPSVSTRPVDVKLNDATSTPQESKLPPVVDSITLGQGQETSIHPGSIDEAVSGMMHSLQFKFVPECPHIAVASVNSSIPCDEAQFQKIEDQMVSYMHTWPSVTSVITVGSDTDKESWALVESRPVAIESGSLEGVYEVVTKLSSSPSIKDAAKSYPSKRYSVRCLNEEGTLHEIHLPGKQTAETLSLSLAEGGKPNQLEQVRRLVEDLPKEKRVVILLDGPSGAGKSSFIKQVKELSGAIGRNAEAIQGDMYFKEKDWARTKSGAIFWDSVESLNMPRLKEDIASINRNGSADTPVFNFITNSREKNNRHLALGSDDILILDSIFAANKEVISYLDKLNIPHAIIYLDSEKAGDRLVRRIVRDYKTEDLCPKTIIEMWDDTIWPGEKQSVRPTILHMDPAQDIFMVTKFPKDAGLTEEEIQTRSALLDEYGLSPSYEAFSYPPEKLNELMHTEEQRLEQAALSSATLETERKKAQRDLDRLRRAPRYKPMKDD